MTSTPYGTRKPEHAPRITRHFRELQGYKLLPWLLPLLLFWGSETGLLRGDWWLWAFLASLAAAVVGSWRIGHWYDTTFGQIRTAWDEMPMARRSLRAILAVAALWVLTLGLVSFSSRAVDVSAGAVAWPVAVVGLLLAWIGWRMQSLVRHAWWPGLVLLVAALAPLGLLSVFEGVHPLNADAVRYGIALAMILTYAIGSHRVLARSLPAPEEEGAA